MIQCCCNTSCTGSITFLIATCSGTSSGGATITATGPGGAPAMVSGNTVRYTQGAGTYTITITEAGYYSRTITQAVVCGHSYNLGTIYLRPTSIQVTVSSACGGLNGTTLTFGGSYAGVSASLSGEGPQTITVSVPDISGTSVPPDWTLTVAQPRYVSVFQDYSWSPYNCSVTVGLSEYSDCYTCCYGCTYPTTNTLLLTGPIGSVALSSSSGSGAITYASTGYTNTSMTGSCCTGPTASIPVAYLFSLGCTFPGLDDVGPSVNVQYPACYDNTPTTPSCSETGGYPIFAGLGSILWSLVSCQPYHWSGTVVMATNEASGLENPVPPALAGTWTLTEIACSDTPPPDTPVLDATSPTSFPGPVTMALTLGKAVVTHVADGGRKASPEVQESRKAICLACPLHEPASDRCKPCGCYLGIKRTWASESCPEGKWGVES